jgi:hypothetical protein
MTVELMWHMVMKIIPITELENILAPISKDSLAFAGDIRLVIEGFRVYKFSAVRSNHFYWKQVLFI